MRKIESSHFTPLMHISIVLTIGIVTGHFCYGYIDTLYWLVASLLSWGISFLFYRKTIRLECLFLYISILCIGGLLTSHQMDKQQEVTEVTSEEGLSSLDKTLMLAQNFRNDVQRKMKSLSITEQDFAIVSAMTLGDKTTLDKETKDVYSISGASHVLAVSGLHIGIIFQLFILLMGGKRRSILTISLSLIAIWSYVVFIGMPASAVRSATMISICCFAMLAHREALSVNNLCFAYVIMLLFNPLYLFDISFQMSFFAVFSILLFIPIIKNSLTSSSKIGGMFCMSLAAQIGTMPLVAFYFGRISCYSLLTGFIAIPAATLILWLSAIALLLGLLSLIPWLSILATPLLHFAISCLLSITQAMNTALKLSTMLPGASIEGIKMNIPQLCLIYFGIVVGYILLRKASVLWKR